MSGTKNIDEWWPGQRVCHTCKEVFWIDQIRGKDEEGNYYCPLHGKENYRNNYLGETYNKDNVWFRGQLINQGGCCLGCGNLLEPGRGTHVDHDHSCCPGKVSCGKCVRGLLCGDCNSLLHYAHDTTQTLWELIGYLIEYGKPMPRQLKEVEKERENLYAEIEKINDRIMELQDMMDRKDEKLQELRESALS
jgi:hypothetical protein